MTEEHEQSYRRIGIVQISLKPSEALMVGKRVVFQLCEATGATVPRSQVHKIQSIVWPATVLRMDKGEYGSYRARRMRYAGSAGLSARQFVLRQATMSDQFNVNIDIRLSDR